MDAPGNKLHPLEGDLAHHWAVSVSGNWRDLCRLPGLPLEVKNMIFNPAHPGEVLKDYLGDITVAEASRRLGVTRAHLSRILNGRAGISASMSLRLSAALRTSPDFWLKMQIQHDLWQEQQKKQPKIQPFRKAELLA